jgi:hypothetical protein
MSRVQGWPALWEENDGDGWRECRPPNNGVEGNPRRRGLYPGDGTDEGLLSRPMSSAP